MLSLHIITGQTSVDYTKYVDFTQLAITEESPSMPTTMQFVLRPHDGLFEVPKTMAYVRLYSSVQSKSLWTGFVTIAPTKKYMGLASFRTVAEGGQYFEYQVQCVSDELLLNSKAVQFIPAFIGRTQGEILAQLAQTLCPGFFDTTTMLGSGTLVPYFLYDPSQNWSQVAKAFGDASRYRVKVRDKIIQFQPYGDAPLGVVYDERLSKTTFSPKDLTIGPVSMPVSNDIIVYGDTETGRCREDYFIGDGFTATFPLNHSVFRGTSSALLDETWNGGLNTQQWQSVDPNTNFDYDNGALNIINTLPGDLALGESYIASHNAFEVAGGIIFQHGEFRFDGRTEGIIGGVYTPNFAGGNFEADDFFAGFKTTTAAGGIIPGPSGAAGVTMTPWIGNTPLPIAITSQANHTYVLQTFLGTSTSVRMDQTYYPSQQHKRSKVPVSEPFGGDLTDMQSSITFVIQDYDIEQTAQVGYRPVMTQYTTTAHVLPAFVAYALVNQIHMNCTVRSTSITTAVMGLLQAVVGPSGLAAPSGLMLPMLGGYTLRNTVPGQYPVVDPWPSSASGNIMEPPFTWPSQDGQVVAGHEVAFTVAPKTGPPNYVFPPRNYLLGAGNAFLFQTAQIIPGKTNDALQFFVDSIPAAGTRIRLQTWEAQTAVARWRDQASVVEQAAIVGDDGVRSVIIGNMKPLPRTSEDCDSAAHAYLTDHIMSLFAGGYICTSQFFSRTDADVQWWPTTGRYFSVYAPYRDVEDVDLLITGMTTKCVDPITELIGYQFKFSYDTQLEKMLSSFIDPTQGSGILTAQDKVKTTDIGSFVVDLPPDRYLPDLQNAYGDYLLQGGCGDLISGEHFAKLIFHVFDTGVSNVEIRRLDANWGHATQDLIVSGVPPLEVIRQQYDQTYYARAVESGPNGTATSRRTKVLRVRAPLPPDPPLFLGVVNGASLQFDFQGDMRNIYGIEIGFNPSFSGGGRIVINSDGTQFFTTPSKQLRLVQRPVLSKADLLIDLTQTPYFTPYASPFPFPVVDMPDPRTNYPPDISDITGPYIWASFFNAASDFGALTRVFTNYYDIIPPGSGGSTEGAWTPWTPNITQNGGDPITWQVVDCAFIKTGSSVKYRINLMGTIGAAPPYSLSLPMDDTVPIIQSLGTSINSLNSITGWQALAGVLSIDKINFYQLSGYSFPGGASFQVWASGVYETNSSDDGS